MMTTEISVTLPQRVFAQDYHEFDTMARFLTGFLVLPVKVEEVAFCEGTGQYVGLVYTGRRPDRVLEEIRQEYERASQRLAEG
jgi:predicted DNA-binding transcriptional regulator